MWADYRPEELYPMLRAENAAVVIHPDDRKYGALLVGGQGTGKTSALLTFYKNDVECDDTAPIVIDPKSELARLCLRRTPPECGKRLWFLDLGHPAFGMNPLRLIGDRFPARAESADRRHERTSPEPSRSGPHERTAPTAGGAPRPTSQPGGAPPAPQARGARRLRATAAPAQARRQPGPPRGGTPGTRRSARRPRGAAPDSLRELAFLDRINEIAAAERHPGAETLPRLYDEDFAILALLDRAGLVSRSLIGRACAPERTLGAVARRLVKLHRHGLIAQHGVGIREHARADGKPPLLYSLTRRGMEIAQTREPPAISRRREWRPVEQGRALRLAHDLHALAWGIELHRLLGDAATDHWRTPRYATGRYPVPQVGSGRDRHPITLNEIPVDDKQAIGDLALKQFAEIKPDLSLELRISSIRLSFDLLVELDLTSRPAYNRDKLLAYGAFLCGWSLAHPRYQTQGTRPAVVFVCSDTRAVLALAREADETMTGRIGVMGTGPEHWYHAGRDHMFFAVEADIHHGELAALALPARPPALRERLTGARELELVGPTGLFDRKLVAGGEWGCISTVEVVMRPPEVFVRPLSHQGAVKLKRMSTRAEHQATRIRAAILLASNVQTSVPQIARMWLTDESHVRKVIHEFNEEGFDSLRPDYRGGRPRRITPTERKRVVAVAGARPDTQGVPLTRWSLDRLSAHLADQGVVVSPIHLWRLLAEAGLSFQRTRSWKASPDPDYQTRAARVLELYGAAPIDGPVISFDQMGPISLKPIQGAGWAARKRPERLRATYNRKHGIRYIFGALDVHRDRLYARMRPRRAGSDVLGYMRTIRLVYPARQKIYWIQDNLSANWTPDIRAFAAANRIELVPTPTYASYLNRIESHLRPIQEFVFNNTDYPNWDAAQSALANYITHRNGRDHDRRIAALERKHRVAA